MKLYFLCPLTTLVLMAGMAAHADATKKATLPLVIYSEAGGPLPFVPSGYMGNTSAIKMNDHCTTSPHSGKTCLQVDYTAKDQWGGVVWQNPANNWGAKPGGWNLTGAKTLSFWARGAKGGETVTFVYGLVGKGKPNADTSSGKTEVHLTRAWKKYTIPLTGRSLSHIITGFAWTLAGSGSPETFYLDDIRYS